MERWVKYKKAFFNIAQTRRFHVVRITFRKNDTMAQPYYSETVNATKAKPYVLMADHEGIGAFKDEPAALEVAEDMIKGKFDV